VINVIQLRRAAAVYLLHLSFPFSDPTGLLIQQLFEHGLYVSELFPEVAEMRMLSYGVIIHNYE